MTAEQFGDIEALNRLEAEAANDAKTSDGNGDAFDELNNREQNGGGSWPFDPVIAENAAIFTGIGFSVLAKKRGSHWAISQDDGRRVGVAVAQVIHRYMPDFDNVGPVGNLAIVGASLVAPRLMLDAFNKSKTEQPQTGNSEGEDFGTAN